MPDGGSLRLLLDRRLHLVQLALHPSNLRQLLPLLRLELARTLLRDQRESALAQGALPGKALLHPAGELLLEGIQARVEAVQPRCHLAHRPDLLQDRAELVAGLPVLLGHAPLQGGPVRLQDGLQLPGEPAELVVGGGIPLRLRGALRGVGASWGRGAAVGPAVVQLDGVHGRHAGGERWSARRLRRLCVNGRRRQGLAGALHACLTAAWPRCLSRKAARLALGPK
mmetsp:Transcript_21465/g.64401  ORF Transcript_21465/g.64401 Transcript_21465/m.64401 type:complete len:226 (-) Transcript_21465:2-679(-)